MANKGNKNKNIVKEPKKWFLPLSIFIICITSISLYHKSVNNAFLDLDDMTIFVKNYSFINSVSNVPKAFTQGVFQGTEAKDTGESYYRPILILSFMLDTQISPAPDPNNPSPKPYLKANIFYHTLACILLLILLLEFDISPFFLLMLTLIFTVHPLINQAVAWIPGRNDSLMSIFILLSIFSIQKYLKSKKNIYFILHILFFVLALFTKENAIMFIPLVFLMLHFYYFRKKQQDKDISPVSNYKKLGIAYILCVIPWLLIRQYSLSSDHSISTPLLAIHNLFMNSPYFIQYAGKAIMPFNLSVMSTAADTNYLLALFSIGLLGVFIYLSKNKNMGLVITGVAWFLLFITPTLSSGFSGLEHRTYLPLMGIIIIVSQLDIIKNSNLTITSKRSNLYILGYVLLSLIVILFYALSASRLSIFQDRFSFDKSAMETSPNSAIPCIHLGKEYELTGDYNNSLVAYREALKRDSTAEMIHNDIAGEYIHMNNDKAAENELRLELARHPDNHVAVFNLGFVIFKEYRDYPQCVSLLKKSISMDSTFLQPYKALSQVYQTMGDSANTILYRNLYYQKSPKS